MDNGKTISLQPEDLFRKLVTEKRGGYCFEMNALFCEAVQAMGLPIYGVLARVAAGPGGYGGHSHRMNLAEADGVRWICDVGYGGDCFIRPLRLEFGLFLVLLVLEEGKPEEENPHQDQPDQCIPIHPLFLLLALLNLADLVF